MSTVSAESSVAPFGRHAFGNTNALFLTVLGLPRFGRELEMYLDHRLPWSMNQSW
jgi:hypothetical protein